MKLRELPALKKSVSEIGLGCWQFGGDFGTVEATTSQSILEEAAESGITFLDTADVYGGGRSEELIGRFLKSVEREEFVIASKVGRTGDLFPDKYTRDGLRARVENCLQRLDTDYLDLIQLHCIPPSQLERSDIFDWLRELRDEGKIRAFGASVEDVEQGMLAVQQEGLASLQVIFNVFRQKPRYELFPAAREKGVGIIVRLPLNSGLLSGKMSKATTFEKGDHRNYNRDGAAFFVGETFGGIPFEKGLELVEELRELLPDDLPMAAVAQRFILDFPAVTTVITGASKPGQAVLNASASSIEPLPDDLHERLRLFYEERVTRHIRCSQ